MPFTREQIDAMRLAMEEEHKKDMDAFARMLRFTKAELAPPPSQPIVQNPVSARQEIEEPTNDTSLIGGVLAVVQDNASMSMTRADVYRVMLKRGFQFPTDPEQSMASIGVALAKLASPKRRAIRIVRKGKGRQPNVYRALPPERAEDAHLGSHSDEQAGAVN